MYVSESLSSEYISLRTMSPLKTVPEFKQRLADYVRFCGELGCAVDANALNRIFVRGLRPHGVTMNTLARELNDEGLISIIVVRDKLWFFFPKALSEAAVFLETNGVAQEGEGRELAIEKFIESSKK